MLDSTRPILTSFQGNEILVRMLAVHCDQNGNNKITMNGNQVVFCLFILAEKPFIVFS